MCLDVVQIADGAQVPNRHHSSFTHAFVFARIMSHDLVPVSTHHVFHSNDVGPEVVGWAFSEASVGPSRTHLLTVSTLSWG